MSDKHSHYHKDVSHLKTIDVYRTLELFGVTDQALGHAIKKLMCAGKRGGGKTFEQDVREAVDTLNRRLQMLAEDDNRQPKAPEPDRKRRWEVGTRLRRVYPSSSWFTEGKEYEIINTANDDWFEMIDDTGQKHSWTFKTAEERFVRA